MDAVAVEVAGTAGLAVRKERVRGVAAEVEEAAQAFSRG